MIRVWGCVTLLAIPFFFVSQTLSESSEFSVVFTAPESSHDRDLRYVEGLTQRGLYDLAFAAGKQSCDRLRAEHVPDARERLAEMVAAMLHTIAQNYYMAELSKRTELEQMAIVLRREIEETFESEPAPPGKSIIESPVGLRYATALLDYYLARIAILLDQGQNEAAGKFLAVAYDLAKRQDFISSPSDKLPSDEFLRMEFLWLSEQVREKLVQNGVSDDLNADTGAVYGPFVKYLAIRRKRISGKSAEATSLLASLETATIPDWLAAGLEAERLRLMQLDGRINEAVAAVRTKKEAKVGRSRLATLLAADLDLARLEILLAAGKNESNGKEYNAAISARIRSLQSYHVGLATWTARRLLRQRGLESNDSRMTTTAAETAWRDGQLNEAVALYDAAAKRAHELNDRSESFRNAATAAAIVQQQLESESTQAVPKRVDPDRTKKELDLLNRLIRLATEFSDESRSRDFHRAALDLAPGLLKSGFISFDDYLKLRIGFLLRAPNMNEMEEFRFRTIALALANRRFEPGVLLLKENAACASVSQAVLSAVLSGMKSLLFNGETLKTPSSSDIAGAFLDWNAELQKERPVSLNWSHDERWNLRLCQARALFMVGRTQEALDQFAGLLKERSNDVDVLESLAIILSGDRAATDRAIAFWNRVAANTSSASSRWLNAKAQIVRLRLRSGHRDEAKKLAELLILGHPDKKEQLEQLFKLP